MLIYDCNQLFLSKAIDPPKLDAMKKAWSILEELGAVDWEGRLTALGRQMVRTAWILVYCMAVNLRL